jgi:hypothetical protein
MILAVDLDNTLSEGGAEGVGAWLPGAQEALHQALEAGAEVLVHTCRTGWLNGGGVAAVEEFLRSGGFAPCLVDTEDRGGNQVQVWAEAKGPGRRVGIWVGRGKPIAQAYVDDRGVAFNGSWAEVIAVLGLEPSARLRLRELVGRLERVEGLVAADAFEEKRKEL